MGSNSGVAVRPQVSTVLAVGTLPDGKTVSQEMPLPHDAGVSDPQLIFNAIQLIRQVGGIMFDGEKGSVNFYPLLMFVGGINFSVKRVILAIGSSALH